MKAEGGMWKNRSDFTSLSSYGDSSPSRNKCGPQINFNLGYLRATVAD